MSTTTTPQRKEIDLVHPRQKGTLLSCGFEFHGIITPEEGGPALSQWKLYTTGPMAIRLDLKFQAHVPVTIEHLFERVFSAGVQKGEDDTYRHIHRALKIHA